MDDFSCDPKITRAVRKFALAKEGINIREYSSKDCQIFSAIINAISRKKKLKEMELESRLRKW